MATAAEDVLLSFATTTHNHAYVETLLLSFETPPPAPKKCAYVRVSRSSKARILPTMLVTLSHAYLMILSIFGFGKSTPTHEQPEPLDGRSMVSHNHAYTHWRMQNDLAATDKLTCLPTELLREICDNSSTLNIMKRWRVS